MILTTLSFIECVSNPNHRFKTLKGIYAVCNKYGEPVMHMGKDAICFQVVWNQVPCWLHCFLNDDSQSANYSRIIATRTEHKLSPYLTQFTFLNKEITIFDKQGNLHQSDAILQVIPNGEKLSEFLRNQCQSEDCISIYRLLDQITKMSEWLYENAFSHRNITPCNIIVTPLILPVLVNYNRAKFGPSNDDNLAIAVIAMVVFIAACAPNLYLSLEDNIMVDRTAFQRLARLILEHVTDDKSQPLRELSQGIANCNGVILDRKMLNNVLKQLALCDNSEPYQGLRHQIFALRDSIQSEAQYPYAQPNHTVDFTQYSFVSVMSDNLIVVDDNGQWKFLNKDGQPAIAESFKHAYDFEEGRAVVDTESGFGLINKSGDFVIPPIFNDMSWDCDNGLVTVMKDGFYGLYNRSGEEILPMTFDRIDECNEDLIGARNEDGNCGYLRCDGSIAIDFIYENVSLFSNGHAVVELDHVEYIIDTNGNIVSTYKEQAYNKQLFEHNNNSGNYRQ